jgi:hypothetical protein
MVKGCGPCRAYMSSTRTTLKHRNTECCWTCTLRRKKCDGQKPTCVACKSRSITCHGFGDRPQWIDSDDLKRAELKRIKENAGEQKPIKFVMTMIWRILNDTCPFRVRQLKLTNSSLSRLIIRLESQNIIVDHQKLTTHLQSSSTPQAEHPQ